MESVKQLFQVFTNKILFVEWILQFLRAITIYFLKIRAGLQVDVYAETNQVIDMRTAPRAVRANIIHDEAILSERWNLCSGCEFLNDSNRCEKCGCFMKVKHKLAQASCPIGKWKQYKQGEVHGVAATV